MARPSNQARRAAAASKAAKAARQLPEPQEDDTQQDQGEMGMLQLHASEVAVLRSQIKTAETRAAEFEARALVAEAQLEGATDRAATAEAKVADLQAQVADLVTKLDNSVRKNHQLYKQLAATPRLTKAQRGILALIVMYPVSLTHLRGLALLNWLKQKPGPKPAPAPPAAADQGPCFVPSQLTSSAKSAYSAHMLQEIMKAMAGHGLSAAQTPDTLRAAVAVLCGEEYPHNLPCRSTLLAGVEDVDAVLARKAIGEFGCPDLLKHVG
jgi:hypothetical protein